MKRYDNGFVIVSGYDMENPPGATAGIKNNILVAESLVTDKTTN